MKRKLIAIVLTAVMSCQPIMAYAAEAELSFSDSSENAVQEEESQDDLNEDESFYDTENSKAEETSSADNNEELIEDENSSLENDGESSDTENIEELEVAGEDNGIGSPEEGEESEFSDGEDDFSDGSDQGLFSSETQSEVPDYDVWLSNTVMSGLNMNGTIYGNSMYKLFKQMQEPIYAELGGIILDDVPLMSISSVWNDVIKKNFYNNQKLIYETLLMEYIKYENKTNVSSFNTSQVDRANAYLIKMFNKLADKYLDEGIYNWSPNEFMSISVEDAVKSFENVETMQKTLKMVQSASKNTKELFTLASTIFSLNDIKQERIQLIKNARNACAGMENPNNDFISACDEVVAQMESVVIDISYARTQSADKAVDKIISTVWKKLSNDNPILKAIDLGADTMDVLFNTSDATSNNLKLSILYTMDCYFKIGLSNAATQYISQPTDSEAAQTFNSCFEGYVNFQIYGNHTAKSWISSVTDGGALNHAFTYIFYRENLKNASELKNLCDSQNKTRNQILNIISKYQDIYSNLYMKDEYKQAMSTTITPTPIIDSKDYSISEGITSPNPIEDSGKCGDSIFWKLFKDGTLILYGTGSMYFDGWPYSWNLSKVKKVKITEGVTEIGPDAFLDCEQLKSVIIPDTVKEIGEGAFFLCTSLTTVILGNRLEKIGSYTFGYCEQLKSIIIPDTVKEIDEGAFSACSKLTTVTLGNKVEKISKGTFELCEQLKSITIPNTVKEIGEGAFSGCDSLTTVRLGNKLEKIKDFAFEKCKQLKRITIPNKVKEIGDDAFGYCTSLTIYGYSGSYAQTYAKQNSIPFVVLRDSKPTPTPKPTTAPVLPTGKFTVKISQSTCTYNGKTQKPSITVTYKGKKLSNKYYTVKYANNKNIGTATVTVAGKDIYRKCSGQTTFKIVLKTGEISSLKAGKDTITVEWKTIPGASGYQIQYSTSKNFAKPQITKIAGSGKYSTTLKKLTSGKTYYVRVRAYTTVNKKAVYGTWSDSKKATLEIALKTGSITSLKAGKKSVTVNWKTISGSNGYQIQYSTSKNFAKAKTVKITGAGKHSTTIKKLTSKKTYYLRVRAYKTVNKKTVYGAWSVSKKVIVK